MLSIENSQKFLLPLKDLWHGVSSNSQFCFILNGIWIFSAQTIKSFEEYLIAQDDMDPTSYLKRIDAVHLIHNERFDPHAIGIAQLGTLCNYFSAGIDMVIM